MADTEALPLPPVELRFMSEDDVRVISVGQNLAGQLRRHGLVENGNLLDIGSGYGRLAYGLWTTDFAGRYHGLELLKKQVTWCQETLAPAAGDRYTFTHLDIRNGRYNPKGKVPPPKVQFPVAPGSQDNVALFSVFTHMYEADIRRYLRKISEALKPGGVALTTWFLYDADRLPRATSKKHTRFPMVNEINAGTRYTEPTDPLRAIAYRESLAKSMIAAAGLELRTIEYGNWCGDPGAEFQDIVVLVKPLRPPSELKRKVKRAVGSRLRKLAG